MVRMFLLAALLMSLSLAAAELNVVATTSSMGMLAREVGGQDVQIRVLAPPDRDAHSLQAKPSMIRALRGADLLIAVGAELEVGWLPAAIRSAANPSIIPGRLGYFEAAAQVPLLDTGLPADRSLGDVHSMGNPHVQMDPQRMATIARALAEVLARLEPTSAELFRERARDFASLVAVRIPQWRSLVAGAPGVLLYHKDADYLMDRVEVPVVGYLEPLPGVPPTAAHLHELTRKLQDRSGIILYTNYQPSRYPQHLAGLLNWPTRQLPLEPPLDATARHYLDHLEEWVRAIALGKSS